MNFRKISVALLFVWLGSLGSASARHYFNDQKAPQSLTDLRNIQKALQENLEKTRAATVCVEVGEGSGTGVIISPEGLVLTAAHVTAGVDVELTLLMEDGSKVKARSLGLHSETDAAMVQILEEGPFPYVTYNTTSDFKLGDWVFSLGHSGGFDKERGVVTRLGRLTLLSENTVRSDCLLIGGDSGGPLFDMTGTLIGIHSRVGQGKYDSRHVPLEEFQRHWENLKKGEFIGDGPFATKLKPGSGFLGLQTEFDEEEGGLIVKDVFEESPAEKAGLKPGMRIIAVNDKQIEEEDLLKKALELLAPGGEVKLTWIVSENETREETIELIERP